MEKKEEAKKESFEDSDSTSSESHELAAIDKEEPEFDDIEGLMLIEKEEPEFEETEDLESVVQAVLLQSAEIVSKQTDTPQDFFEPQDLERCNQNNVVSQLKNQLHSPANVVNITTTAGSVTTATRTTTSTNSTDFANVLKISSGQCLPKVFLGNAAPFDVNNSNKQENLAALKQIKMLQNAVLLQNMQAAFLHSRNLAQLGIPRVGNLPNTNSSPHTKPQPSHILRMGVNRFGPNSSHFGLTQNRFRMAKLSAQATRYGAPQFGLRLPVPRVSQPMLQNPSVMQSGILQTSFPRLCVPPWANIKQSTMQPSQLHFLQNLQTRLQRPVGLQQFGHHLPSSSLQNLNRILSKMKANAKSVSKTNVPFTSPQLNIASSTRVTQRGRVPSVPGQFGATSAHQLLRNCPQFNVPQLPVPQVLTNASGFPLQVNMLSQPRGSVQSIFRPPTNIPQLRANLSQQLTDNLPRSNVPQPVNSGLCSREASLTTNVQRLRSPQMAANVSCLNFPGASANSGKLTGNLLPRNMTQFSINLSRPRVPYTSNIAQVGVSRFTKSVPRLPPSQLSMSIPQFPSPQLSNDTSFFVLPPARSNLGVTSLSDLVSLQVPSSTSHINLQDVITRATHLAHSVPHTPSTSFLMTASKPSTNTIGVSLPDLQKTAGGLQQKSVIKIQKSMGKEADITSQKTKERHIQSREVCQRGIREPLEIPGVLQPEAAVRLCTVNTSQQSASVLQLFESRKRIIPQTATSQNQRKKQKKSHFLKFLQRKHIKHQLALLSLWKQFKKYHIGKLLIDVNRKKLRNIRKQRS